MITKDLKLGLLVETGTCRNKGRLSASVDQARCEGGEMRDWGLVVTSGTSTSISVGEEAREGMRRNARYFIQMIT